MHRITISLPEELALSVTHEAERAGTSVSEFVRRAVATALGFDGDRPADLPFAALGHSGTHHTARDAKAILKEEWTRARRR